MRPNRLFLLYCVVTLVVGLSSALLACAAAALEAGKKLTGLSAPDLASPAGRLAILSLGLLPWPGLVLLARAVLKPSKPSMTIDRRPLGTAVVVLTALNEEKAVEKVVADFASVPGIERVILVDNGSTDRTVELGVRAGACVVREPRRGYGFACRRALSEGLKTGCPVIILCEADGTFSADDVVKLMLYLTHADLVVGSRVFPYLLSGDSQLNSFFILGNLLVAKLLQIRYWDWTLGGPVRLTDVGCTYLAIRAEGLHRILPTLGVGGNHFVPHLLMNAIEHGLRVVQIPITFWRRVGASKGGNASWWDGFKLGLAMVGHILTYQANYARAEMCAEGPGSCESPADSGKEERG